MTADARPTPLTDAFCIAVPAHLHADPWVKRLTDSHEALERRLAEAEERAKEQGRNACELFDECRNRGDENAQLRARVAELERALREARSLENLGYNIRNTDDNSPDESGVKNEQYRFEAERLQKLIDAVLAPQEQKE